jgi:hypothetical protein
MQPSLHFKKEKKQNKREIERERQVGGRDEKKREMTKDSGNETGTRYIHEVIKVEGLSTRRF